MACVPEDAKIDGLIHVFLQKYPVRAISVVVIMAVV